MRALCLILGFATLTLPSRATALDSDAEVWLAGGTRSGRVSQLSANRETSIALGVSLPWERWLAAPPPQVLARLEQAPTTAPDRGGDVEPEDDPPLSPAERPAAEASEEPEQHETALVEPGPRRRWLSPDFVRQTLRRALAANGYSRATRRDAGLASRARWSALLPELRLRAARATDRSLRLAPTLDDPYRYTRDGGTDVVLEARATWRLSRLVFAEPELAIERLRLQRAMGRRRLVERVLKELFRWQRAHASLSDSEAFVEQHRQAELDQLEAELTLNALTGGWFTSERVAQ